MFDVNEMMRMASEHREQKQKRNAEAFLKYTRDAFMKETPEEVSRIYTRDKNNSLMKLCKMKSGNFSILNRNTDEVLFTCSDLHEAKVEFIVMQSITDGGMGSKIFEKAMNL